MTLSYLPTSDQIYEVATNQVRLVGGTVAEVLHGTDSFFARCILNLSTEVFPGDTVDAGIAIRVAGSEVEIHPYQFRQICKNGLILGTSSWSLTIQRSSNLNPEMADKTMKTIKDTILKLAGERPFDYSVDLMRRSKRLILRSTATILRVLQRANLGDDYISEIITEYLRSGEPNGFGLVNAMTAIARNQSPAAKWQLEKKASQLPALLKEVIQEKEVADAKSLCDSLTMSTTS